MTILATAQPNKLYVHYQNFREIILQAGTNNGRIHYYEIQPGRMFSLSEETVKALFPTTIPIKERPFLVKGNEKFYAVLYRNRTKYKEQFTKLYEDNTPLKRTK